ncbi:hypothetical protein XENTR_v10015785 [Xenopus tropicalis]|nr:hypothetical protein XENTR_v10015785 [Xenopus tropicalis]
MTDHCCCGPPAHGDNCKCYMECLPPPGLKSGPGVGGMDDPFLKILQELKKELDNIIEKSQEQIQSQKNKQAQPIKDPGLQKLLDLKKDDTQIQKLDDFKKEVYSYGAGMGMRM